MQQSHGMFAIAKLLVFFLKSFYQSLLSVWTVYTTCAAPAFVFIIIIIIIKSERHDNVIV